MLRPADTVAEMKQLQTKNVLSPAETVAEMKQLGASGMSPESHRQAVQDHAIHGVEVAPICEYSQDIAIINHQSLPKTSPPLGVTAPQKVVSETCRETVRTLPSASPTSIPALCGVEGKPMSHSSSRGAT